jgi:quercetin dioxygenase-like cupin family protein
MDIARGRQPNSSSIRASDTFTGTVFRDPLMTAEGVNLSTIMFEPGAHTYWHSHSAGQLLFIDHGKGVVGTRAGEVHSLHAADVLYAPPGEEHWHGAAPDAYLAQTTVSMGSTDWLEAVTPEQYREACEGAASS